MKKFLIAIIMLIPILVVLALNATGSIIALAANVNAKDITVMDAERNILGADSIINVNMYDDVYLIIEILPYIVYDDSIVYFKDENGVDTGAAELVRQGDSNRYTIVPVESGICRLIISPKTNAGISKAVTINIKGTVIKSIDLYDADGVAVNNIKLKEQMKLYADIYPIDALSGEAVWSTENEAAARVTQGGVLYPTGLGITKVRLTAFDLDGREHRAEAIVDTTGALVSDTNIYSSHPVSEEWIRNNVLINKSADVERIADGKYTVSHNGEQCTVTVGVCGEREWGFTDDCPEILYTNNGSYFFGVEYLEKTGTFGILNAAVSSSNNSVAYVDNGRIYPLKAGVVTISATAGGETKEKTIIIKEKPVAFNLQLNTEDYNLGIRQMREWAVNWFDDGMNLKNEYQFGSSIDNLNCDLVWQISDSSASIDENALITFTPDALGKSITVTAGVKAHNHETKVKRSFRFDIHSNPNAVNVYDDAELHYANDSGYTVIMQRKIELESRLFLRAGLIGNGFELDVVELQKTGDISFKAVEINQDMIANPDETVVMEDFMMEGTRSIETAENGNCAIRVGTGETKVIIKNAILQHFREAIYLVNEGDVTIEGSIIGDCYFTCINSAYDANTQNKLTFKNTILKATLGPTVLVAAYDAYFGVPDNNIIPYTRIEGFLDIYNWKTPEELSSLFKGMSDETFGNIGNYINLDTFKSFLGTLFSEYFAKPESKNLTYYDAKTKERYINLGVIFIGLYCKLDPTRVEIVDEDMLLLPMPLPFGEKSELGRMLGILEITASTMGGTLKNPCYLLSYDYSAKKEPRNKPGDPIPQSREIFEKLRGIY